MDTILQSIADAGIKVDKSLVPDVFAEPEYRGNFGFFHVRIRGCELLFVKGVFKNNIRSLGSKPELPEKVLNILAQILADAERCLRFPVSLSLHFNDENFFICSAEKRKQPHIAADCRDMLIPEPLTPVEASLGRQISVNDKYLFAKSPFSSFFGETLSPFAFSILEQMPDIINPLFMSAAVKTCSPSIKPLYGRFMLNINNIDTISSAFRASPDLFYLSFLPSVFKSIKKPVFNVPDLSILNIKDGELEESLNDINTASAQMTDAELFGDNFFELCALCFLAWELAYLKAWRSFSDVCKNSDVETAMRHIYKSRKSGLLRSDAEIMPFFDPVFEPRKVRPLKTEPVQASVLHKSLPASKRILLSSARYEEKLACAHHDLDMLDNTRTAISSLVLRVRKLLLEEGKKLTDKNILPDPSDVFFLEYKEIKNIRNDSFYGNIPFTLNFRKWQNHRQGALCLPAYFYEKDIENLNTITAGQIGKSLSEKMIPCASFFHKTTETSNFICKNSYTADDASSLEKYDAVIAESASVFSFAAQYCATTDTPLYYGARFGVMLTAGKTIVTEKDKILLK